MWNEKCRRQLINNVKYGRQKNNFSFLISHFSIFMLNFAAANQRRRVGRVIDRAGLEIRYTLMGIGGLNPSPSAKLKRNR